MVLTNLILPLIIVSVGLLLVKNKKYLFLLSILPIIITIVFMIYYTISDNYNNIVFLTDFIYPIYSIVILFCISFILGMSFILLQKNINYKEIAFIIVYFAFSLGVLFADNFIDLIIYWEFLALSATLVILQSEDKNKKIVALKYFVIHTLGGIMIITGATDFIRAFNSESFPLNQSLSTNNLGNLLILGGILINLAIPPFSSWLTDGYSKCSTNASIFLSIFTTKASLFVLLKLFYGSNLLIYAGIFIAAYGLIFSLFESSIRRILAMAIIQQLGIIVISIASVKVFDGFLITYITVDVLYKIIAFMLVVILVKRYKTDNIYKLKNSINLKSILGISLLICSLQAVGAPITGGFVVKTYLVDTIESLNLPWLNYVIVVLFAGVALNIGIKIPYYLINFKSTSKKVILDNYLKNIPLIVAIVLLESIFIFHGYQYFDTTQVLHSLKFILIGVIFFVISVFFINTKEDKIRTKIDNFNSLVGSKIYYILGLMVSEKPMNIIYYYFRNWYLKIAKFVKVTTILSSRNMVTWILIFLILLYMSLRYHQLVL